MRKGNIENDSYQDNKKGKSKVNKVTTKNKIWMFIWLCLAIFIIYQIFNLIMYTLGKRDKEKMWLYNTVNSVVQVFSSGKSPSDTTEEYSVKFAGLGDIYFTANTIRGAKSGTSYDFTEGISAISEELKKYDLVVASLKTPIAGANQGYSTKTSFNAPNSVVDLLKELNVSAVATATNHALDKNEIGVNNTIENLKEAQIEQVGINSESRKQPIMQFGHGGR